MAIIKTDHHMTPLQINDKSDDVNKAVDVGCCCCGACGCIDTGGGLIQQLEHVNNNTMVRPKTVAKKSNDKNVIQKERIVKAVQARSVRLRRCRCRDPGSLRIEKKNSRE